MPRNNSGRSISFAQLLATLETLKAQGRPLYEAIGGRGVMVEGQPTIIVPVHPSSAAALRKALHAQG